MIQGFDDLNIDFRIIQFPSEKNQKNPRIIGRIVDKTDSNFYFWVQFYNRY